MFLVLIIFIDFIALVDVTENIVECDPLHDPINGINSCTNRTSEICVNLNGTYQCVCKIGYKKDNNSGICQKINMCIEKSGNGFCEVRNAKCQDLLWSFKCNCLPGTVRLVNSRNMDFKCDGTPNPCQTGNNTCKEPNQVYKNRKRVNSGYKYDCADGFTLTTLPNGIEYCARNQQTSSVPTVNTTS